MNNLVIGTLAHVDAGKTTLCEALLHLTGAVKAPGRVDRGDSHLDTAGQERSRGITISSHCGRLTGQGAALTLIDTPGHVDFSPETERALSVIDIGLIIINASEGVRTHTLTLWKLLKKHHIPAYIFVNKMDRPGTDRTAILKDLQRELSPGCTDFTAPAGELQEALAALDEALIEQYLDGKSLSDSDIAGLISTETAVPVYFGSALKEEGIEALLKGLAIYGRPGKYLSNNSAPSSGSGALVYKISRDSSGTRLTHVRITSGSLSVRDAIAVAPDITEKINEIRLYNGDKYETVTSAQAGTICTLTGLSASMAGKGLGSCPDAPAPELTPVLSCQVLFPGGTDLKIMHEKLKALAEEEPTLHLGLSGENISIRAMGQVQLEILQKTIEERLGISVSFGPGQVIYKETIGRPVEGVGHFEPLRHYAEVHLLLSPLPAGSGLITESRCKPVILDTPRQKQILGILNETIWPGVLTGSELTDMHIALIAGRDHPKHTEGGDFRQAACRALRQGLMAGESILLEPVYEFTLEIPADRLGRAINDIQAMSGSCSDPASDGDMSILTGIVPVSELGDYPLTVSGYTGGRGRLSLSPGGYRPCHNTGEVVAAAAYNPLSDPDYPCDSVFCSHGAGHEVSWQEVPAMAHVPMLTAREYTALTGCPCGDEDTSGGDMTGAAASRHRDESGGGYVSPDEYAAGLGLDKELTEIFDRTYGAARSRDRVARAGDPRVIEPAGAGYRPGPARPSASLPSYLIVDGYNIIFAWKELKDLARYDINAAREALADILINFNGFMKYRLTLVYDAYRVDGGTGHSETRSGIDIIYTGEGETADARIERLTHDLKGKGTVTVATSDGTEQAVIFGNGALRMTAGELRELVEGTGRRISEICSKLETYRNLLGDYIKKAET